MSPLARDLLGVDAQTTRGARPGADEPRVRPLDALQWVVEQRTTNRKERVGERWTPKGYCRTRDGVLCLLSRYMRRGAPDRVLAEERVRKRLP